VVRTPGRLPPEIASAAFTVGQGRSAGVTPKRLRGGDLQRPFRGVREPATDAAEAECSDQELLALRRRCDALELVLPPGAFFSHLTAARLWPLPLPRPTPSEPLHVSVFEPQMSPRRKTVAGHRVSDQLIRVVRRGGYPLVDAASLFCQLAAQLSLEDLVAAGDALVLVPRFADPCDERPYVSLSDLAERVDRSRGRGKARAWRAVGLVRPGAESRPETLVRLAIGDAGLPEPEVNPDVYAADGTFIGRGDMVYRKYKVLVEYDGEQHRTDTRQYDRDIGRLDRFDAEGWRVVRLTGRAFFADRATCLARIEQALLAAGWRR